MSEKLDQLKEKLGEVADIGRAAGVLSWDQQVNMPPGGNEARGRQLATLSKIAQEKFITDEVGKLIDELKQELNGDHASDEAALVRVAARNYDKAKRVPPEFIAEQAIVSSRAFEAWVEARSKSDFSIFHLTWRRCWNWFINIFPFSRLQSIPMILCWMTMNPA